MMDPTPSPSIGSTRRAIVAHETRDAIRRYHEAKRHQAEIDRAVDSDQVVDFVRDLANRRAEDAEMHLLKAVLMWDPDAARSLRRAEKRSWRPRGVVYDGRLY